MTFLKRTSKQDIIFDYTVLILLLAALVIVLYPLYFVVIASVSDANFVNRGEVVFYPKGINLGAYKLVIKDNRILTGYANTIFYTVFGTLLNVIVTICAAFPLSRKNLLFHKFWIWFFLLTMYFNGGLIPLYLQVKSLGLVNTRLAIIVIGCVSVYNLIICRTFFETNIPEELCEAASIDGCSMIKFFFRIVLPNSKAIVAIMVLYYAVGHWNDFFNALIYLNNIKLYPLQLILRDILLANQSIMVDANPELLSKLTQQAEVMKYAIIIVSSLPVLMLYPQIQKYFVNGVMVGAVKG